MNYFKIFDFIDNEKLKRNLVLDYKEVLTCLKRQCPKGTVVLVGGIVEAILINKALTLSVEDRKIVEGKYFELSGKKKKIEKMDLFYLIRTLVDLKIITTPQAGRSDILRDCRNLIHPFKTGNRPIKKDAESVKKLLDDLINELGKIKGLNSKKIINPILFFEHPKYKDKRAKIEYQEILGLFYKKRNLRYEELLDLPSFQSKKNPSKSLIAHLNCLRAYGICKYDLNSWQGYNFNRYEKWILNNKIRCTLGKYLKSNKK